MRQAQIDLKTSRAHSIELYDFASIGYLTLNAEDLIIEINLPGAKLFGYQRKTIINWRFADFIGDDCKNQWRQHCLHIRQTGKKHIVELPLYRKDNSIFYAHIDCLSIINNGSAPLMRLILADITEHKQAKEAQSIAATAFETEEGIIVADARKVILRVNKAFTRITGYNAKDAIGQPRLSSIRTA
ncbi:MAG: PAS domain-containing protein [Methylobacter sp.]|nr:PAS domain-containing protein [Methylobacter sp.]